MTNGDIEGRVSKIWHFCGDVIFELSLNIAEGPKYDLVYKFLDKETSDSGIKNIPNKELAEELHKPIIRKSNKRKLHSPFIDNIWGAGLAYMQLIGKFNKGFRFLLCVFHIYSEYA